MSPKPLELDLDYLRQVLVELLEIPSPSGRTDHIQQYVGERLSALGISSTLTRRGALSACLPGPRQTGADRAVVVHTDTIGGMVKRLKENGRLEVKPIGTHSARFAEGAHVRIFTDDLDRVVTGQVLPLKASGHRYNEGVDLQGVGWELVEVRVDEPVTDEAGLRALGVDAGDFVALLANPTITPSGYVKSRHLDDKAGVAAVLTAFKAMVDAGVTPAVTAHLLVTVTEEIGHGASHGLDPDVAEIVSVDAAVVAPGQQSREAAATRPWATGWARSTTTSPGTWPPSPASTASTWSGTSSTTTAPTWRRRSRPARTPGWPCSASGWTPPTGTSAPISTGCATSPNCSASTSRSRWSSPSGTPSPRATWPTSRRWPSSPPPRRAPARDPSAWSDAADSRSGL